MFKTQYDYLKEGYTKPDSDYEKVEGISETVPDMHYSIRQLLDKFTSGNIPDIAKQEVYEDVENWEQDPVNQINIDYSDLDDVRYRVEKSIEKVDTLKKKMEEKKKEIQRKEKMEFEEWKKNKINKDKEGGTTNADE